MKYSKIHLTTEAIKHRGFLKKIPDIFRMIKFWIRGEYKADFFDIILPLLGFAYIISPIDIIPEIAISLVGVLDDLAILSLALPKLMKEVDKFLLWEERRGMNNSNIVEAEIID